MDNKKRLHQDMREWLAKHQKADELIFSQISGYPVKAIYYFPFGKYSEDEFKELAKTDPLIAKAIEVVKNKTEK